MDKKIKVKDNATVKESFNSKLNYDMIIFCHLRWDFVYQRPQHIISRMSEDYKILVVEEPIHNDGNSAYDLHEINPNLSILKPKVKSIVDIKNVLDLLNIHHIDIAWFYSPAFVDLLPYLKTNTIIYDCMDELSQFKGASMELRAQEKLLIQEADLVFTGGKSLYEAKAKLSADAHCFPSSVDVPHFKKANGLITIPEDIKNISNPIVGYIGVIDERINLPLVEKTAELMPQVSFVMIGPLAKIRDEDLPRASNIYYLGMKQYKELPGYLKAFDIAMMPFALNESTEFISPTKTLEYMAADKPIISTAIKDVVRDYSEALDVISNAEEFSAAISRLLQAESTHDSERYQSILNKTSWDTTVRKMKQLINVKSI
ncbi:glycosyltransferase [Gelidibacter gilvus]|uniref:Glycosyltransferase family 1 protein n=1 Tax=Gelidibacter gilvus TaxID=59602 RepID=A0A4Q0XEG3_9FLAO|nr:glycosyltransferase [Gelidibacter gilvus]RXJ44372.1 glycosyltransferase family 1 protein [Gelidibacter gilvus]